MIALIRDDVRRVEGYGRETAELLRDIRDALSEMSQSPLFLEETAERLRLIERHTQRAVLDMYEADVWKRLGDAMSGKLRLSEEEEGDA